METGFIGVQERAFHPETPIKVATLLKKQKGKCPHCGLYFKCEEKHGNKANAAIELIKFILSWLILKVSQYFEANFCNFYIK